MHKDPINTSRIENFIKLIKSCELSRTQEVNLKIQDAKNLAFDLGILLARLHGDLERYVQQYAEREDEIINITMDGGKQW